MKILLFILLALMVVLYALLFWPAPTDSPDIVRFLILSMALAAVYFAILYLARKFSLFGSHRRVLLAITVAALLIRAIALIGAGESTYLSDDVYRYIWEGKLVAHGYNPYVTPPHSLEGTPMADDIIYPRINDTWLPTISPPAAQYLFTVAYMLHDDSIVGFKVLSALFELLTLLAIVVLASPQIIRRPFDSWIVLIYALSPLVMIEFLMSNHLDILAMPFFIFSLIHLRRGKIWLTGIMLALAALVQLFALMFAPIIFFHLMGRDRLRFTAALLITMLTLYLPFIFMSGMSIFGSLFTYLGTWQFNGSIFTLLKLLAGETAARIIGTALFLLVLAAASILLRRPFPKVGYRMFIVFGAYVILTPSLFPWYLVWILPFLVIYRNLAFLVLTGTVFLSYHVLIGHYSDSAPSGYWWLTVIQYLPFYALLLYPAVKKLRKSRPKPPPQPEITR